MSRRLFVATIDGIDLAPTPDIPQTVDLTSVHLFQEDVNVSIDDHEGAYDLVHLRLALAGISDISRFLPKLKRCLRSGGILLIVDMMEGVWDVDDMSRVKMAKAEGETELTDATEDGSWLARLIHGDYTCHTPASLMLKPSQRSMLLPADALKTLSLHLRSLTIFWREMKPSDLTPPFRGTSISL